MTETDGASNEDVPEDIPENAAKALERVFLQVRATGQGTVQQVWEIVLDAPLDTPEFVRRHSGVVKLVDELCQYLMALPEAHKLRQRHADDIVVWYRAVVSRDNWTNKIGAYDTLISANDIKHLASLGDIIALSSSSDVLSGDELAALRNALRDWQTMLDNTPALPEELRTEIKAQIEHIDWLIKSAAMLGYKPIVKESRTLISMGFSVLKYTDAASEVMTCMAKVAEAVSHFSAGDYGQGATALSGAFTSFGKVIDKARNARKSSPRRKAVGARKPQKEIEGPKRAPKSSAPERPETNQDDVIEAEVVEDED